MPATATPPAQAPAPAPAGIPFAQGAHEHVEIIAQFAYTPTAAAQVFGPFDVPPSGYERNLALEIVTTSNGVIGAGVASADYPFNIIQSLSMNDVNGAPIVGPIDGYALMWANIVAGTQWNNDPRLGPWFSNTIINPAFFIRVPNEITTHDGLGCLANQDASATYKLYITLAPNTTLYTTQPTTPPTLQITVWLEAYTVPSDHDMFGNPQAQAPPALGTAQYITFNQQTVLAGANTIPLKRTGNLLECLVMIFRTAAGARSDSVAFNPFTVRWDNKEIYQAVSQNYLKQMAAESLERVTIDAGVYIIPMNMTTKGGLGNGPLRSLWPTTQSSRIEFAGSAAVAGSVQIVTIDIAAAQVNPSGRYVMDSATGASPAGTR